MNLEFRFQFVINRLLFRTYNYAKYKTNKSMNLRKNINRQLNFPRFQSFVICVDLIFKQNFEIIDTISTYMINIRNIIKKNNLFKIVLYTTKSTKFTMKQLFLLKIGLLRLNKFIDLIGFVIEIDKIHKITVQYLIFVMVSIVLIQSQYF